MARLKCKKTKKEMEYEEAECPNPENYCENRNRCGIWFLREERRKKSKREAKDADV